MNVSLTCSEREDEELAELGLLGVAAGDQVSRDAEGGTDSEGSTRIAGVLIEFVALWWGRHFHFKSLTANPARLAFLFFFKPFILKRLPCRYICEKQIYTADI